MRLARVSALALALVTCAWFVLGVLQARDTNRATAIVASSGALTSRQAAHASALLRTAGTLNPDTEVEVLRARIALREKHQSRAEQILEGVVRDEPLNLEGWHWLAVAASGDNRVLPSALVAIARLHPTVPRAR